MNCPNCSTHMVPNTGHDGNEHVAQELDFTRRPVTFSDGSQVCPDCGEVDDDGDSDVDYLALAPYLYDWKDIEVGEDPDLDQGPYYETE